MSSKQGQFRLDKAREIKKLIESRGKKAYIFIMDEIEDEKLLGLRVDAFVNTACLRITDGKFSKPIINAEDVKEVLE